jgi:predicted DCC family thiol-disulfide oxidoreductase YuxK
MRALESLHRLVTSRTESQGAALVRIIVGIDSIIRAAEGWNIVNRVVRWELKFPYAAGSLPMDPEAVPFYIGAWVVAALAFAAGWHTRVAGSVLAASLFYGLFIDQQVYSNHQLLLGILVTLLTLANCGATFSLDARRRTSQDIPGWPIFLLKAQLTLVYGFSAIAKLNLTYISGVIIFASLRDTGPLAFPQALRTPPVMAGVAVASIAAELFLAMALWSVHWRRVAVVVGILFHIGLVMLMLPSQTVLLLVFGVAMTSLYLLFFEHAPVPLTVYYDDRCGICSTTIDWLRRAAAGAGHVRFIGTRAAVFEHDLGDVATERTIVVVNDRDRRVYTEARAFAALFRSLPLLYQPLRLMGLPGLALVADAIYRQVAKHRHRISAHLGSRTCKL